MASRQEQQKPQELAFELEVIVTNIDVVVTGSDGKRVLGLNPENFRVYEDGLPQKLTNFYEVKGLEAYAYAPDLENGSLSSPRKIATEETPRLRNKVIFYFDNWQLHPLNRNWSIKKVESFIRNNFAEGKNNEGLVVSFDQKLEILQEFTSDPVLLLSALEKIKERTGESLLEMRMREEMREELNRIVKESQKEDRFRDFETAFGYARNFVEAEQNTLLLSLKSLNAFLNYLAGVEGRKSLIYVSDSLTINPAEEVFAFLDQAFPLGNARVEALNYDITQEFKELTARANGLEVTIYPVNAQGLETGTLTADKAAGWRTYNRGGGMVKSDSRLAAAALKIMAGDTGGQAILNTNDIEKDLAKVADDLEYYYSLGYKSLHRTDNEYHTIKVELAGVEDDYDVRVRQGYIRISRQEKIKEAVFAQLFLPQAHNPMGIKIQVLPVEKVPGQEKRRLNLKLLIPIRNLMLVARGESYTGQIKVYFALKDREGELSPCYELTHEIKIPAADYEVAMKSSYPYLTEMFVDRTLYTISMAVEDVPAAAVSFFQFEKKIQ